MLVSLLILASGVHLINAAGFTSHNSAARRAAQFEYFGPKTSTFDPSNYFGLAMDRPDAIQGGAPFPDYLYACGDEHDAGEEAHWTPFQMAAADYIRTTYPTWAEDGRQGDGAGLVAFMMGVVSHYIADMNWHGLETVPSGEGLIRTVGYADFNCTDGDLCQAAHSACDTGGEFAAAAELNISWYPESRWYIPTDDLVNIYAAMNATGQGPQVQPEWIEECAVIFYVGSWAVSTFGNLVRPIVAPYMGVTLQEQYLDFPVGGIDDDAAWTGFMQNRFADWVSNGPPDTPPNQPHPADMVSADSTWKPRQLTQRRLQELSSKKKLISGLRTALTSSGLLGGERSENNLFQYSRSKQTETGKTESKRGTYVGLRNNPEGSLPVSTIHNDRALLISVADVLVENYVASLVEANEQSADAQKILQQLKQHLRDNIDSVLLNRVGYTAANVDNTDIFSADLLSSTFAVQPKSQLEFAAVDDLLKNGGKLNFQTLPSSSLRSFEAEVGETGRGSSPHAYFGSAITVANFHDGNASTETKCDVLVGSFGVGRSGGPQEGSAQIQFGKGCSSSTNSGVKTFRGGVASGNIDAFPSYERFGYATTALDMNGDGFVDAVICAPSFGGRNITAVVGNYSGRCDVFLGPFTPDDESGSSSTPAAVPVPALSIFGDRTWGLFGHAITAGDVDGDGSTDLIISAPYAGSYPDIAPNDRGDLSSQGAVYVYFGKNSFRSLWNNEKDGDTISLLAADVADFVLQRPASFQQFGRSLTVVNKNHAYRQRALLLVGAPTFHAESPSDAVNSAVGRVYAYDLGAATAALSRNRRSTTRGSSGNNKNPEYVWSLTGSRHAGRTGQAVAYSDALNVLAVGEPAYNGTWALDSSDSTDGEEAVQLRMITSSSGSSMDGRVGTNIESRKGTLRAGRVLLFSIGAISDYVAMHDDNKDVAVYDFVSWQRSSTSSNRDVSVIEGHRLDARMGSTLSFMSNAAQSATNMVIADGAVRSRADHLLVGSPLADDGAGLVSGYDVFMGLQGEAVVKVAWSFAGLESKGRTGVAVAPLYVRTSTVNNRNINNNNSTATMLSKTIYEYGFLAGSPLANADAGVAPDGDQVGRVYSVVMTTATSGAV